MRKRGVIILVATFLAVTGGLAWLALSPQRTLPPDPVYDGQRLSVWVSGFSIPTPGTYANAITLPSSIDSNALPYLAYILESRDGGLRKAYNRLRPALPAWLRDRIPAPRPTALLRHNAFRLIRQMGADDRLAIPELVRLLREDEDRDIRVEAIGDLGVIARRDDKRAVEALALAARDKDPWVREEGVLYLRSLNQTEAAPAGTK